VYHLTKRWEQLYRLAGHTDTVSSLAMSPCGRYLASAAWDGKAGSWIIPSVIQALMSKVKVKKMYFFLLQAQHFIYMVSRAE
jgi:WD40 repeat protein